MGLACKQRIHVQLLIAAAWATSSSAEIKLQIDPQVTNTFDPRVALGAGIDGHEQGEIAEKLSPANIRRMRSAGLKPLTYRLRTELAGEAWHWNPRGSWSDAANEQGYWTSESTPSQEPINVSYGYRLPRRGNTIDQANNDGYSRIDDGDPTTFWKSNPFLDGRPQWIAVDLGRTQRVDTVRMVWGTPRATRFHLEFSDSPYIDLTSADRWLPLPEGQARDVRWLRIVLEKSAGKGFAVCELAVGSTDKTGHFTDVLRHGAARDKQSVVWVSSTDPWHRAIDMDPLIEQPGVDFTFRSGLSNSLPVLMPVGVLYDTPDNNAALMSYLKQRGYPVTDVELGEEPEEQFVTPEDYAELSRLNIAAIRAKGVNPRFGGPSLILLNPNLRTDSNWMSRLYRHFDALSFFSFEWYPFDDICGDTAKQVEQSGDLLAGALRKIAEAGVPRTIPWYMTEYGFSAYGAQAEVDLPGAILNAESVALFLTGGGARAYLYGYEPGELLHDRRCTWGDNAMFLEDKPTATYWAARVLTESWSSPEGGPHKTYRVATGNPLVSAYGLRRPSGELSILVVNKSATLPETVHSPLAGTFTTTQFSGAQYQWHAAGEHGRIVRSEPPVQVKRETGPIALPPYSLTVLTGNFPEKN